MNKLLLVFIFSFCIPFTLLAQNKTIKGTVVDENGTPVENVSVIVKGTGKGDKTNKDGEFSVTVPAAAGKVKLEFSSTGYKGQSLTTDGTTAVRIRLAKDIVDEGEVVVIGYQTKSVKDVLAPLSTVSSKQLQNVPVNSAAEALTGRLAGVQVTTAEGEPGAEVNIKVRGGSSITQDNSPLYIIDGVTIEGGISSINPQDIENVTVLKDASATAIYGSRGANGVIIITTKSGRSGKTKISYNGFIGVKTLPGSLDVLEPYDFVLFQYERSRFSRYTGVPSALLENGFSDSYGTTFDTIVNYKKTPFTDWQKIMMDNRAITQTHSISVNGGNKKTQFNFNYANNVEEGILLNSKYTRNLFSAKIDHRLSKKLKVGVNLRYNDQVIFGSGTSDGGSTSYNRLRQSVKYRPFLLKGQAIDAYDDEYADETNSSGLVQVNPVALSNAEYKRRNPTTTNLSGYFQYNITKKITFKSTVGYDRNNANETVFSDSITPDARYNGQGRPLAGVTTVDRAIKTNSNVFNFNFQNLRRHHDIDGVLGQELYISTTSTHALRLRGFNKGITSDKVFDSLSNGTTISPYPVSREVQYTKMSFFGRVNYAFDKKYLLSLTLRTDGSSKFKQENRWGYFPSASIGWRVSSEKFMRSLKFINDFKIRAGYGASGNDKIDDYQYIYNFYPTSVYGLDNSSVIGYGTVDPTGGNTSLANEFLKWETNVTKNLGVDISLFKSKITLSVDIYKNSAEDLLIQAPVPGTSGYSTQLQNIGATSNKGVEVSVNANIIQKKNFSWTANFNIAFNKNTVDRLSAFQQSIIYNSEALNGQTGDFLIKVGQPLGSMYGYVTDGMYQVDDFTATYVPATDSYKYTLKPGVANSAATVGAAYPGTLKLKDISGPAGTPDGVVNGFDRTIIGNANPDFTGGLNQTFTFNGFDLSVFFNFVYGNDVMNANKIEFTNAFSASTNVLSIMKDRWTYIDAIGNVVTNPDKLKEMNKNATLWIPSQGTGATAFALHSWAIEDGSFLRLNNISFGYSFSNRFLKKSKLSKLRMYVTANNIAVFTSYSGYDPEVNTRRRTPVTPGVDYSAYPKSRSFILGLNLTL